MMKMHRAGIVLSFTIALVPVSAYADSPREFLQTALEGDNSEIMLGRLAADRARSPRVKEFGNMLVSEHGQARDEVLRLGRGMGVRDRDDVAPQAREERRRLSRMGGRDFDREFVRYMVEDHRKDVADFRDETRQSHGLVSELARRQLPTLQKHLEMAMDLERRQDRRGDRDAGGGRGFDQNDDQRDMPGMHSPEDRGRNGDRPYPNDR